MRSIKLFALLASACPFPVLAAEQSVPAQLPASYRDRAFIAFNDICLKNRGSWQGMKQAAASSPLGLKVTQGKGRMAIDYMAFPVSVILRQQMPAYLCVVQSVVEDPISGTDLTARLTAEGFGLQDVQFKVDRKGVLNGAISGTERSTGRGAFSTNVGIRLSKSAIAGTQILQLALTN
jgi:hypothetical protein